MRNAARLVVVAALATTTILPTTSASAVYCGDLDVVCRAICAAGRVIKAECLD